MKFEFDVIETLGLKDYLIKYYSFSLFGYLKERHASIFCDDVKINLNDMINKDSHIVIDYLPIKQNGNPSNKPINIVYEDEDCIVINKDSGVCCIPSRMHQINTLFNRLQYYFLNKEVSLHFINRLDKDTSGLVLICKNQFAACLFSKVSDTFIKEYIVDTNKALPNDKGCVKLPIQRVNGMKRWVDPSGKMGITDYELISNNNDMYRYKVRLHTGLTHQIRVHFAYLGSPIINDALYGNTSNNNENMHLCASYLKFYHPLKNKWISLVIKPNF